MPMPPDQADIDETVTADDVAAAAGVSRWTVARAFKKDASISRKSREKVMAAAEALGYAPDLLAASLASDRSNWWRSSPTTFPTRTSWCCWSA